MIYFLKKKIQIVIKMSDLEAGLNHSENNICQGLTFEQHQHLGPYIKQRRGEAVNLSVVCTWCHNKSSTVCKLASNMENALSILQSHLHDLVCREAPPNSILFKNGYNAEIDPVTCYYGRAKFADQWNREFIAGFREEFSQQQSQGLYAPHYLPRRRKGFTPEEHLHVAKIMRSQVRQSAIVTTLIWATYGKNSDRSKPAYKWWKLANGLISELDKLTGKTGIYDITHPTFDEADRFKVEIAAYRNFAEPIIVGLQKSFPLQAGTMEFPKQTNYTRNLEFGLNWLQANLTEP
jgi:hypothetical protein